MYIYAEFKVEIRRGREGRHGHRVTVECEKPDGGRVGPTDAQPITSSVTRLMPAASAEQRIDLGEELGQCMFPPRVLAAFTETLRGFDAGTGIRVRLLCVDEEMARWPWELVRIAVPAKARSRYLFRDERFSLVRTVIDHRPVDQPKERRKLVILTVDATKVLDEQELEPDFPEQLAHVAPLQRLDLTHPTRRTIDELIDQVADGEDPLDIFHFTGHGRAPRDGQAGALVLYRDQDTGAEHYRGDELARQLHRAGTSLAFVNACYTDQAATGDGPGIAQSLTGIVPVVIAMRDAVRDRDAKDFAETFYQWLLNGSTVDEAVARGRAGLDESLPGWGSVVLYSRASSGRFLEPMPAAAQPALAALAAQRAPGDGVRRWAMMGGAQGHWQVIPGEAGPELRRVEDATKADISHLRLVHASLALSGDARVVAQVNRDRLALAWVDRVRPRLDRWPHSFELALDGQEIRLLAVAVDYGDEVVCVLSTDQVTYRVDVAPKAEPLVTPLFEEPTRYATMLAGQIDTVDCGGRVRGWDVNQDRYGIAEVSSLDGARSGGRAVYALAGRDEDGRPIVAKSGSTGTLVACLGTAADEVVVVRPLSAAQAPAEVLLSTDGHIERAGPVNRVALLRDVSAELRHRRLVWAGIRGDDAEPLADLPQFEGAYTIINAYSRRLSVDGQAYEDLTGVRVDLETWDIDDHLDAPQTAAFRRVMLQALSTPSALLPYRPSSFLSAIYFARRDRCLNLGLFGGHQAAFEHKPWVETSLADLGVRTIPWTYVADEEQLRTEEMLRRGPLILRRSRTSGGEGIVRVDDAGQARLQWPHVAEAFVSVAPFLSGGVPVNVGATAWHDGVTVHYPSVQLIGIPDCVTRPFGYCGNDYGRVKDLGRDILDQIETATITIGNWLRGYGYRGTFGVDFLVHGGVPLFTEVNPRFQGSTHASCKLAIDAGQSCLMLEHLAAILGMSAPPQRPVAELAAEAPALAHFVVHWTGDQEERLDPSPLVRLAMATGRSIRAEVQTRPTLLTQRGAAVARIVCRESVTQTGFELTQPWAGVVSTWKAGAAGVSAAAVGPQGAEQVMTPGSLGG